MSYRLAIALAAIVAAIPLGGAPIGAQEPAAEHSASGFLFVKMIEQAACQTIYTGGFEAAHYTRGDCTRVDFSVTNTDATSSVKAELVGPDGGAPYRTLTASRLTSGLWRVVFRSDGATPAGKSTMRIVANGVNAGDGTFFVNALAADVAPVTKTGGKGYAPGEAVGLQGSIYEVNDVSAATTQTGAPATFYLRARTPTGEVRGPYGPYTAGPDGTFPAGLQLPAAATRGLTADASTNFRLSVGVDVIDATSTNALSGAWASKLAGSGAVEIVDRPSTLLLENKFVSSLGWVKPGQAYPFRVFVKNFTDEWKNDVSVTIPAPSGVTFTGARALKGAGTVTQTGSTITWRIPAIATDTSATLVANAQAATTAQDPRIVWKDLSTTATMTYAGGPSSTSESRGPKVIPPAGGFETARYGDKPFPMIPVDFRDRKHKPQRTGEALARVVNSKDHAGSTYNLYQEMSFGQLHPFGSVPSAGIASAKFDYEPGFAFTERDVKKPTCRGATLGQAQPLWGTPAYPERIKDGWYQLPGDTEYYGGDFPVFSATTIGIDAACGDTAKMIFDAVAIADPEIDYNEFDSDKDGVVDFTMVVFAGCGGNGGSQLSPVLCEDLVTYDNPWPHSSTLEATYTDPDTGLAGYTSDDQLQSLENVPQCWKDDSYSEFADCEANGGTGRDELPVHVRVGPYNINPETAIDHTSVIAHEYGHHLGLPDFYSGYSAYNEWNLMASDYSQHMTVFGKQELGWVVPEFLQPGESRNVTDWEEIKNDTGRIEWRTPNGTPYTLSGANGDQNIHNGQAFSAKLPRKLIIDPQKVESQASAPYVWWSGRGNDFGCAPKAGHNFDVILPELEFVPEGTPITLSFKSSWDIEWDFDYGFVLATTDGATYSSLPSAKGFTTPGAINPNTNGCQTLYGNGITGTSGAAAAGPAQVAIDRAEGSTASGSPFVADEYDLSQFAGRRGVVLRFSYSTDPGLDRPGWFIDDLKVKAGDEVVYSSDFSTDDELRLFPGGCNEGMKVSKKCTEGWSRINASQPSSLDHAYYLELRDRSGFDFDSRGQADRGDIGWAPGVLVEYTDEVRGYGNNGSPSPPRQHYLDSQPTPGADCGGNDVEERPEPAVLTPKRCEDAAFTADAGDSHFDDTAWVDNFWDDSAPDGLWHFDYGCLTLDVDSMAGHSNNTGALPSDLTANARITAGAGCAAFDYWDGVVNAAPTAAASANPKTVGAGLPVTFDANGTFDDLQPAGELGYSWAFGDGTTATGSKVTHSYATKGVYTATLTVTDHKGLKGEANVEVAVLGPDLTVTNIVSTDRTVSGSSVRVTATIRNAGPGHAPATTTEVLLDGWNVLGTVGTPGLAPGQSTTVAVLWDVRNVSGEHSLRATVDKAGVAAEEAEGNNTAHRLVTVRNNRVTNGTFGQG